MGVRMIRYHWMMMDILEYDRFNGYHFASSILGQDGVQLPCPDPIHDPIVLAIDITGIVVIIITIRMRVVTITGAGSGSQSVMGMY